MQISTDPSALTLFVPLSVPSQSLVSLETTPFLLWSARGLLNLAAQCRLVFLLPSGVPRAIADDVKQRFQQTSIFVFSSENFVSAVAEYLDQHDANLDLFAIASTKAACAPADCLTALRRLHDQTNAWATMLLGGPPGVTPLLVSTAALRFATQIQSLVSHLNPADDIEFFLRTCIDIASRSGELNARCATLSFAITAGVQQQALPNSVDLIYGREMKRLERLTSGFLDHCDNYGAPLLVRWKQDKCAELSGREWLPLNGRTPERGHKRVLFASWASAYTGASESLCEMIGHLPRDWELHAVLGMDGFFASRLRRSGVIVHIPGLNLANLFDTAHELQTLLSNVQPDIVYLNDHCGPLLPLLTKLGGMHLIYHARVAVFSNELAQVLEGCDDVITVSSYVKTRLLAMNVPAQRCHVVYDGVDTNRFKPIAEEARAAAKRALGIDPDACVILMVARFAWNKRHDLLIHACQGLLGRYKLHLLLVGESFGDVQCERSTEQLIQQCGLSPVTTKRGFQADISSVEHAADIAVLPSEQEPLGTFILESLACAVPVIVSDDGGLAEIVSPRVGLIFPKGNVEALRSCLESLIADPERRKTLGFAARQLAVSKHNIERHADSVAQLLASRLRQQHSEVSAYI